MKCTLYKTLNSLEQENLIIKIIWLRDQKEKEKWKGSRFPISHWAALLLFVYILCFHTWFYFKNGFYSLKKKKKSLNFYIVALPGINFKVIITCNGANFNFLFRWSLWTKKIDDFNVYLVAISPLFLYLFFKNKQFILYKKILDNHQYFNFINPILYVQINVFLHKLGHITHPVFIMITFSLYL